MDDMTLLIKSLVRFLFSYFESDRATRYVRIGFSILALDLCQTTTYLLSLVCLFLSQPGLLNPAYNLPEGKFSAKTDILLS